MKVDMFSFGCGCYAIYINTSPRMSHTCWFGLVWRKGEFGGQTQKWKSIRLVKVMMLRGGFGGRRILGDRVAEKKIDMFS